MMKNFQSPFNARTRLKIRRLVLGLSLGLTYSNLPGYAVFYDEFDPAYDGVIMEQPLRWEVFPETNTETNGVYIVDPTTDPVNPIDHSPMAAYFYDLSSEEKTVMSHTMESRLTSVVLQFRMQRTFATQFDDLETGITLCVGPGGVDLSEDPVDGDENWPLKIELLNNSSVRILENIDGVVTSTNIANYWGNDSGGNLITVAINNHPDRVVETKAIYGDFASTTGPMSVNLWVNRVLKYSGSPTSGWNGYLSQLAFYSDGPSQAGMALTEIGLYMIGNEPSPVNYFEDFDSIEDGLTPEDWGYLSNGNSGALVSENSLSFRDELETNSNRLYKVFSNNDISAARVAWTFNHDWSQSSQETASSLGIFSVGQHWLDIAIRDFRLFELEFDDLGSWQIHHGDEGGVGFVTTDLGEYSSSGEEIVLFINSSSEVVTYNDGVLMGQLDPNMMDVYANGELKGAFLTVNTPNPDHVGVVEFWNTDADLGKFMVYQDLAGTGIFSIDDVSIQELYGPDEYWAGYPVIEGGFVDTGDWMGYLSVSTAPWIYSYSMEGWIYCPEESVTETGAWMYVLH